MLFWRTRPWTAGLTLAAAASLISPGAVVPARADQAEPPAAVVAPAAGQSPVERPTRAGATELTWLGHAAWMLRSPQGTTVLIDPWLTNPKAPQDFALPARVDAILVTHGHADHLGETAALSRRFHAPVVGSHELIELLGLEGGIGANPGGTVQVADLKVHVTQAVHSSSMAPQPPLKPHGSCACHHEASGSGEPTKTTPETTAAVEPTVPAATNKAEGTLLARELAASRSQQGQSESGKKCSGKSCKGKSCPGKSCAGADGKGTECQGKDCKGKDCSGKSCTGKACHDKAARGGKGCCNHAGHDHDHEVDGAPAADEPMRPAPAGAHEAPLAHGELPADAPAPSPHVCAEHGGHGGHPPQQTAALYAGAALGFVIEVENGPTLYHAGDTDVFADMRLIARRYRPEIALLPIGDHYTMGPKDAALAARLLGVKEVLPMHYGTFPLLKGTPEALREALGNDARVVVPRPGGKVSFVGHGDG